LPLGDIIDLVFMFIMEGNKLLYRFTYALLRINRSFLLQQKNSESLLSDFTEYSTKQVDFNKLKTTAFKYKLGKGKNLKYSGQLDYKNLQKFKARPQSPNSSGHDKEEDYDLGAYLDV